MKQLRVRSNCKRVELTHVRHLNRHDDRKVIKYNDNDCERHGEEVSDPTNGLP